MAGGGSELGGSRLESTLACGFTFAAEAPAGLEGSSRAGVLTPVGTPPCGAPHGCRRSRGIVRRYGVADHAAGAGLRRLASLGHRIASGVVRHEAHRFVGTWAGQTLAVEPRENDGDVVGPVALERLLQQALSRLLQIR